MFEPERRKWVGLVVLLGAVIAGQLVWKTQAESRLATEWTRVEGRIVRIDVVDVAGSDRGYLQVEAEYVVDGVLYTTSRRSLGTNVALPRAEIDAYRAVHPVDSPIDVHFDPRQPSTAVLDPSPQPIRTDVWFGIAAGALVGILLLWSARTRGVGSEPSTPEGRAAIDAQRSHRFLATVRRAEENASRDPSAYRRGVLAFSALGDVMVVGPQILGLALVGVLTGVLFANPKQSVNVLPGFGVAILFATWLLRCAWFRLPAVPGPAVRRQTRPELFDAVEAVRARVAGPRIHRIVILGTCRIEVSRRPRVGVSGWTQNTLELGLPVLLSASTDEVEALIAGAFGRVGGSCGRVDAWITRRRRFWTEFRAAIERRPRPGDDWLRRFAQWFAPELEARSIVSARQQELGSDRVMRTVASARVATDAVCRQMLTDDEMNRKFWPQIWSHVADSAEPQSVAPYERLEAFLAHESSGVEVRAQWLAEAEAAKGQPTDHRPRLETRLRILGERPRVPPPVPRSAARAWLGDACGEFARRLDAMWVALVAPEWSRRRALLDTERERMNVLDQAANVRALSPAEQYERASLREQFLGEVAALPLFAELLERDPNRSDVRFRFARALLHLGDARGVAAMEDTLHQGLDVRRRGLRELALHAERNGDSAASQEYSRRLRAFEAEAQAAQAERDLGFDRTRFAPHGLDRSVVVALTERVRRVAGVEAAWLARKDIQHVPECPMLVLGVLRRLSDGETPEQRKAGDVALWNEIVRSITEPPSPMPFSYSFNTLNSVDDPMLIEPLVQHALRIL